MKMKILLCLVTAMVVSLALGGCNWMGRTAGRTQAKIEKKTESLEKGYEEGYEEEKNK